VQVVLLERLVPRVLRELEKQVLLEQVLQVQQEPQVQRVLQVQLERKVILVEQHSTTPSLQQQLKRIQELERFALIKQTYKLQRLCLLTTKLMAQLIFSHSFVLSTIRQAQLRVTCESATRQTQPTLRYLQLQVQLLRQADTLQSQFLM
jgi:hypothetical protein